jgi:hypothetical protein
MKPMISKQRLSNSLLVLLSLAFIVIWAAPLWFAPGKTGALDWVFALHRLEAIRLTVVEYGQWPGHNPWNMGGVPLLGNPTYSLLSIKGLMVLIFGTSVGLRLGILVYLSIGFIGAWKLSSIWWKKRFVRLVFAFFVIANPAIIYHLTMGGILFINFYFMPALFYFLLRFKHDKWSGVKAAIVFGLAFNDSAGYMVQYGGLVLACVYVYLFMSNRTGNSKKLLRWLALFVPVCAAATIYRFATVLPLALDYPRITDLKVHFGVIEILKMYLRPYVRLTAIFPGEKYHNLSYPFDVSAYAGTIAFVLFLFSFRRGIKWWHVMTILLLWASAGNDRWYYLMYWIQKIPSFSSHLCFTRIRVFTLLFGGISAVWGLDLLRIKCNEMKNRFWVSVFIAIGTLMIAEPLSLSHLIMKLSHVKTPAYIPSTNPTYAFQNVSRCSWPKKTPIKILKNISLSYRAIKVNVGSLRDRTNYDPYFIFEITSRIGRDEPGYIGEYHQNGKVVVPTIWSPNRVILNGLKPDVPLTVNMNPGNPWYNNGKQLFPGYRIVEFNKPFEVMPDENGCVDLVYRHPGQTLGITGTILFLFISFIVIVLIEHGHHFKPCKARTRKGSLC